MELGELMAIFGPGAPASCSELGGGSGWTPSFAAPLISPSLAALMFNGVRREDIDYSPYEEGEWRLVLHCIL